MENLRKPDVITVAITRVDGGVTVMVVVVNEYVPDPEDATKRILNRHYEPTEEYIQSIINKHVEGGNWIGDFAPVSWRIVPNDFVDENTDRTFRNAWKDNNHDKAEVDMVKAREIHKNNLRDQRVKLLEKLDIDYIKADESKNSSEKERIIARKQELRDITNHPSIENAQTPEELKLAGKELL